MVSTIKAKQFVLRPFHKGDELSLRRNINNRKIARYTLRIPHPYTAKDADGWVKKKVLQQRQKVVDEHSFAIDIAGDVVGGVGLFNLEGHKAEIGYWLGEKYWEKGIMTAAVKLVLQFGFRKLKLHRIYASVFLPNKASARVLEKAGFAFEGINKKNYLKDGRLIDGRLYAKVR